MISSLLTKKSMLLSLIWMGIFPLLFLGCKVDENIWVEKMLSEMEFAWVEAAKAGLDQEEQESAVNAVVTKYIRPGMPKEDVFKQLKVLESQGFDIGEYRHEGARKWPHGDLKPYLDIATRENIQSQIPPGLSRITAKKQYGIERFIIFKYVAISVTVNDEDAGIKGVEASIWNDSI